MGTFAPLCRDARLTARALAAALLLVLLSHALAWGQASATRPAEGTISARLEWSFDRLWAGVFPDRTGQVALRVHRQVTMVEGVDGGAVRLWRQDSIRSDPMPDPLAGGRFTIAFWLKAEWASQRDEHGDVLNFVTANEDDPCVWRVGFQSAAGSTIPREHWPLVLRIGKDFSTQRVPVVIEPWQWTHVAFVADRGKVSVYRNGELIGQVNLPTPSTAPASAQATSAAGRPGVLQVNGGYYSQSVHTWRNGNWECDLRLGSLVLSREAAPPKVLFPPSLRTRPDTTGLRQRLAKAKAAPEDAFVVDSLLRQAEAIDNGSDTQDLRRGLVDQAGKAMAALEAGAPPLRGLRGHLRLSYRSPVDQTEQWYEVYVPRSLAADKPAPVVAALHGSNEDETVYLERYSIEDQAEKYGWIIAVPYGRGQSGYQTSGLQDVLDVVRAVGRQWSTDTTRLYVTGHSMGGRGTVNMAALSPAVFAAAAPVAGYAGASEIPALAQTPMLWVVGEKDADWATGAVREMTNAAKAANAPHTAMVVPGFDHGGFLGSAWPTVVETSLPAVFEFFAQHRLEERP